MGNFFELQHFSDAVFPMLKERFGQALQPIGSSVSDRCFFVYGTMSFG